MNAADHTNDPAAIVPAAIIRASSFATLFDCAHKWEGVHLLGMRKPVGMPAVLGTAIHASTAAFDRQRLPGGQRITADDAAGVLVDTLRNPGEDVQFTDDDMPMEIAERVGLVLHTRYCNEVSPRYEWTAVELETKPFDIDCGGGMVIRLTGTMDRARLRKGWAGFGITDLKTGATAVQKGVAKTKGHAAQVGTYELLTEHTTGQRATEPAEIIGLKTKGTPEVATGKIANARRIMVGDGESRGLIEYAAEMFRSGLFPPNPQSMLCGERYCARWGRCHFREVHRNGHALHD